MSLITDRGKMCCALLSADRDFSLNCLTAILTRALSALTHGSTYPALSGSAKQLWCKPAIDAVKLDNARSPDTRSRRPASSRCHAIAAARCYPQPVRIAIGPRSCLCRIGRSAGTSGGTQDARAEFTRDTSYPVACNSHICPRARPRLVSRRFRRATRYIYKLASRAESGDSIWRHQASQ